MYMHQSIKQAYGWNPIKSVRLRVEIHHKHTFVHMRLSFRADYNNC